jgi:hypothetical protein
MGRSAHSPARGARVSRGGPPGCRSKKHERYRDPKTGDEGRRASAHARAHRHSPSSAACIPPTPCGTGSSPCCRRRRYRQRLRAPAAARDAARAWWRWRCGAAAEAERRAARAPPRAASRPASRRVRRTERASAVPSRHSGEQPAQLPGACKCNAQPRAGGRKFLNEAAATTPPSPSSCSAAFTCTPRLASCHVTCICTLVCARCAQHSRQMREASVPPSLRASSRPPFYVHAACPHASSPPLSLPPRAAPIARARASNTPPLPQRTRAARVPSLVTT